MMLFGSSVELQMPTSLSKVLRKPKVYRYGTTAPRICVRTVTLILVYFVLNFSGSRQQVKHNASINLICKEKIKRFSPSLPQRYKYPQ